MRIVVVGAGVIGATLTWELTQRGHQVVLVERAEGAAREASFANGGQLHTGHAAPWNTPGIMLDALRWIGRADSPLRLRYSRLMSSPWWALRFIANSTKKRHLNHARANSALALYSIRRLYEIIESNGIECNLRRTGILKVFDTRAALENGVAAAREITDLGIPYKVLDRAQTLSREPSLNINGEKAKLIGAIEFPEDGCADAHLFSQAILERALHQGAELRPATPVIRLRGDQRGVAGVVTQHGLIDGDAVILAAGSYSAALARPLGIRLPIEPIKGYSVTLSLEGVAEYAPNRPLIDDARKIVLTRLGDRLRIAGKAELGGFDTRLNEENCRAVRDQGLARFPELTNQLSKTGAIGRAENWSGLRPMTCNGPPILGPTPVPGLHLATGSGHLGWTFAAGTAEVVADQLEGKQPAIDVAPYRYS